MALDQICEITPEMFGGSADLTGSNLTNWSGSKWLNHDKTGDYLSYGVREFGMAIMNGIQLHGGLKPFGGTFLVFTDYARNAIRMSALMKLPVAYVMTHDSIGLGEDGPTHQPIEHLSSLRLIPNLNVWRPADAFETQIAWKVTCEEKETPSVLALSRQSLPALVADSAFASHVEKGGYTLKENRHADVILMATGSEVELIVNAADVLEKEGISVQVVSMPCVEKLWLNLRCIRRKFCLMEFQWFLWRPGAQHYGINLCKGEKGLRWGLIALVNQHLRQSYMKNLTNCRKYCKTSKKLISK